MKNIFLLFFFIQAILAVGQSQYNTQKDIHYYPDSVNKSDQYIDSQCTLDLYYPKSGNGFATIVWFHGGGLTEGKKYIPTALLDKGYAVIGVGYRLNPKSKSPSYIEDAAAAVAWTFQHIAEFGGNPNLIFVSGHSAGGYLGLMITLDKKYLEKHRVDANRVAALIPFSGQTITHFTIRQERGIKATQPIVDEFAPIYHVRSDAPPILLITGDREMEIMGRYEENTYFSRMMKMAGHTKTKLYELQGFDHVNMAEAAFPLLLSEVDHRIKEIGERK